MDPIDLGDVDPVRIRNFDPLLGERAEYPGTQCPRHGPLLERESLQQHAEYDLILSEGFDTKHVWSL